MTEVVGERVASPPGNTGKVNGQKTLAEAGFILLRGGFSPKMRGVGIHPFDMELTLWDLYFSASRGFAFWDSSSR